jgi:hypothetical protein
VNLLGSPRIQWIERDVQRDSLIPAGPGSR